VALHGDEHADLLIVLHRVARVCLRLGRLEEARRYSERAVRIAERAFGSDNIALVRPLSALAEAMFALGRLDDCYLEMIDAKYHLVTLGRNLRREYSLPANKKLKFTFR